jgi:hypothetical protein
MATRTALIVGLLALAAARPAAAEAPEPPRDWITPGQAEPLIRRILEREPFLASEEARQEKQSLGHFFERRDYEALQGNPILGYWDAGTFRWTGVRVAWEGITSVGSAKPITQKAWDTAFAYAVKKRRLVVDKSAPIRVRGVCVGAVMAQGRGSRPGVALEIRVESPTGAFRGRFGIGKASIEDAVGASMDRLLGFALNLGRDDL